MELIELRYLTKKHFNSDSVDILDMLFVMLSNSSADIEKLFADVKEQKKKMLEAVTEYKENGGVIPQSLLTGSICSKKDGAFLDIDLLEYVLSAESRFLQILHTKEVNTEMLLEKISCQKSTQALKVHTARETNTLDIVCENMTEGAKTGMYNSLTGRSDEISSIENILLRKDKANVILTGEAGVGKTALVELLVKNSAENTSSLLNKYTFYSLDLTAVLSNTSYRGELEQKLGNILRLAVRKENAVFFIDEIHRINQSTDGKSKGSHIAEILKPYLSKDNIRIIGASTTDEYQRYIAKDAALSRRFQHIKIGELSGEELLKVVKSNAEALEKYHNIKIDNSIVSLTIEMTDEYMKNRYQPDKSNDIIDSACVLAAKENSPAVCKSHIIRTISAAVDIPEYILGRELSSCEYIAEKIKAKVFGQDKQVDAVTETIMVRMAGFKKSDAPLAAFMFAGDSGVGKTYLAKTLAQEILKDKNALTVLDMAEYSENHSVSKLIGSPPGYVNSGEEGVLCRALSKSSFSVIVFDEIEKASDKVYKLLLGMMDTGRLTGGTGAKYSADNAVLIFTTNAVTAKKIDRKSIGFGGGADMESTMMDELKDVFPTEFLGRIDEIIMFNRLSQSDYRNIIEYNITALVSSFAQRGIKINGDMDKAVDKIIMQFKLKELGVRGVMDIIRKNITVPLVTMMTANNDDIEIDLNEII